MSQETERTLCSQCECNYADPRYKADGEYICAECNRHRTELPPQKLHVDGPPVTVTGETIVPAITETTSDVERDHIAAYKRKAQAVREYMMACRNAADAAEAHFYGNTAETARAWKDAHVRIEPAWTRLPWGPMPA